MATIPASSDGVIHLEDYTVDDDDDDEYVPESLKGFFAQAEQKLEADLADALNHTTDTTTGTYYGASIGQEDGNGNQHGNHHGKDGRDHSIPKSVPPVDARPGLVDDDDGDSEFFRDLLQAEPDQSWARDLIESKLYTNNHTHEEEEEEEDFLSPLGVAPLSINPAAHLSHGAAKDLAMEGVTPRACDHHHEEEDDSDVVVKNLDRQLEQAVETPVQSSKQPQPQPQKQVSGKLSNNPKPMHETPIAGTTKPSPATSSGSTNIGDGGRGGNRNLRNNLRGKCHVARVAPQPQTVSEVLVPFHASDHLLREGGPPMKGDEREEGTTSGPPPSLFTGHHHIHHPQPAGVGVEASFSTRIQEEEEEDDEETEVSSPQLPPQSATGGVTQRPIGDKGLHDVGAFPTNTITEVHPNALHHPQKQHQRHQQRTMSQPHLGGGNPSPQVSEESGENNTNDDDDWNLPPQPSPPHPPRNSARSGPMTPASSTRKQQQQRRTRTPSSSASRPTPSPSSNSRSRVRKPLHERPAPQPLRSPPVPKRQPISQPLFHRPSPENDRPQEISFLPHRGNGGGSRPPDTGGLALGGVHVDVTPTKPPPTSSNRRSSPSIPVTTHQNPTSPRWLQGTAASQAHIHKSVREDSWDDPTSSTRMTAAVTASHWKGRKELTSPDKVSSRLLQDTNSSKARTAKEQMQAKRSASAIARRTAKGGVVSNRLLKPTETTELHLANSPSPRRHIKRLGPTMTTTSTDPAVAAVAARDREATKARVRTRIELQKQRDAERQQALHARIQQRQGQQHVKKQRMQAALSRARSKRETIDALEEQRVSKLQARIHEKESKAQQRILSVKSHPKEEPVESHLPRRPFSSLTRRSTMTRRSTDAAATSHKTMAPRAHVIPRRKVTPTIPIAPTFLTDQRLGKSTKNKYHHAEKEPIALAQSDAVFKLGLRQHQRPPTPEVRNSGSRPLTIPKGPTFSTSKRHGEKGGAMSVSSPVLLLVDKQRVRNSWEKELRSVSSPLASDNRSTSSRLTIPKTPHFQDIKPRPLPKSTAEKDKEEMDFYKAHPFKARPVQWNLDVGSVTSDPKSLLTAPPPRVLTTPSPFSFRTEARLGPSPGTRVLTMTTPSQDDHPRVDLFKAKPMPQFSNRKSTPLTGKRPASKRTLTLPKPFEFHSDKRDHRTSSSGSHRNSPPGEIFKARRMPNFSRHTGLVMHRLTSSRASPSPLEPEEFEGKFQARPMPNFNKITIPVRQRIPSPPKLSRDEPAVESVPFRARRVPDSLSRPDIPVKQRDPDKLRSPEAVQKRLEPVPQSSSPEVTFNARPAPKRLLATPSIPVRDREPGGSATTKRRSPGASPGHTLVVHTNPGFHARPLPRPSPPNIPVRSKDPTRLRSPTHHQDPPVESVEVKPFRARGMPKFYQRRDPSPTKTSFSLTPSLDPRGESPPKRQTTEKMDAKARVRDRMMGKKAASSGHPSSRFSSAKVRARLQKVAPVASPEPVALQTMGLFSGVPSSIQLLANQAKDAGKSTRGFEKAQAQLQRDVQDAEEAARRAIIESEAEKTQQMQKLKVATQQWMSLDDSSTPKAGKRAAPQSFASDPPSSADQQAAVGRREAEAADHRRLDETMQMAHDLQRAAEDELSFHGSIQSKEQLTAGGYSTEGGDFL